MRQSPILCHGDEDLIREVDCRCCGFYALDRQSCSVGTRWVWGGRYDVVVRSGGCCHRRAWDAIFVVEG
jgi:hypothetical protein